jgi:hypothetical protein
MFCAMESCVMEKGSVPRECFADNGAPRAHLSAALFTKPKGE